MAGDTMTGPAWQSVTTLEEKGDANTVRRIEQSRPEQVNALSAETIEDLHDALDAAAKADPLVPSSNGRSSFGGFDLMGIEEADDAQPLLRPRRIQLLLEKLHDDTALIVAGVSAAAVGASADLVLSAGARLVGARDSLRLSGSGFGAELGTSTLPATTSPPAATELALTGRVLAASEASGWASGASRTSLTRLPSSKRLAQISVERPRPTVHRIRAAARPVTAPGPMGALVRSRVSDRSLRDRLRTYRERSRD